MRDITYWIWLSLSVTPGGKSFNKLISKFGSAEAVYSADENDIIECIGSRSRDCKSLAEKDLGEAERIKKFCEKHGVGVLLYCDDEYPESLRGIDSPPVLLYYRGKLPDFKSACTVSMVGTRNLSDYGRKNAFHIGYDLALSGITLVSGMALGIDGVSHAGALAAGGVNVAILGCGIDICYPSQHLRLAREIIKSGCIMTEYAPGRKADRYTFPKRNRIIAALSAATIVVEGRERSGSLITARYAREFGRCVYALPGNVDNKTSRASNLLIKNGAKLITSADDVIADMLEACPGVVNPHALTEKPAVNMFDVFAELEVSCVTPGDSIFKVTPAKAQKKQESESSGAPQAPPSEARPKPSLNVSGLDGDVIRIYNKIPEGGAITTDELVSAEDKMPFVMKALLMLEMRGFVTMLPGERVTRSN